MKSYLLLLVSLFTFTTAFSQILTPCKWANETTHISGDEFEITFTATLDDGWAVYSQNIGEDGPIPTSFNFETGSHFELNGKAKESETNRKEGFDDMFGMNVIKFYKKAVFTQKVTVKDYSKPVTGYIEFMVCDDARCLPPTEKEFSIVLKKKMK